MQYVMLTLAAMLLAVDFVLNKIYQKAKGTSPRAGFGFNSLLGLFTAIIFFVIDGFKIECSVYSLTMAAFMSFLVMCYNMIGFQLLKSGSVALYTLFLMTGGMIVPYIYGILFLNEPFSGLRTAGLFLILFGVVLSNFSNKKLNCKQIMLCAAVFFLNGFVSVISKLHQIETAFYCVNAAEFVILGGLFKFIFAGMLYFIVKGKNKITSDKLINTEALLIIAASAVVGGFSYLMQLLGAASLPATILYPFITGGSIVFSALVGSIFLKEKISKKMAASVIFCFIGTVLFL